mmetsp:Transcript_23406/g.54462  ORF Transcript_23406/g.54462 Transcript_23406/m.54462 type:complete len:128 (+) Transcript_23406:1678-2061(+)
MVRALPGLKIIPASSRGTRVDCVPCDRGLMSGYAGVSFGADDHCVEDGVLVANGAPGWTACCGAYCCGAPLTLKDGAIFSRLTLGILKRGGCICIVVDVALCMRILKLIYRVCQLGRQLSQWRLLVV